MRLEYERGPGARQCPDEANLRGEVAAEIGLDPFTEAGPWRLHAAVTRGKNGSFVATADLFDSDGATFSSMEKKVAHNCRSLVLKALAAWVSWQLTDPPLRPPSLPTAPPPPPPPPPPPSPPPRAAAAAPPSPAYRLRLGAATGVEIGVGPTPTPLFSLNLAFQFPTVPILSLALEARSDLPLPATGEGGARVHALAFTGSVLTCFHAFEGGIVYGCPMFTAGVISSGDRFSTADASSAYSAAGARLGVAIPFASSRFAFTLAGDILGTLHPFRLFFDKRLVWQTGYFTGAVQAGFSAFL